VNDKEYWDNYYSLSRPGIAAPTTFARYCAERLDGEAAIYELGCGNGRDVHFFAEIGHRVTACDRSHVAIEELRAAVSQWSFRHEPELIVGEMGALPERGDRPVDAVYSRFTLHAVTAEEASLALRWAHRSLRDGGRLFAEARSVRGSLYGLGVEVARDTFLYNEHTRRFLRLDELTAELEEIGFTLLEMVEDDGLAVHKDDDPVVIRVVARK